MRPGVQPSSRSQDRMEDADGGGQFDNRLEATTGTTSLPCHAHAHATCPHAHHNENTRVHRHHAAHPVTFTSSTWRSMSDDHPSIAGRLAHQHAIPKLEPQGDHTCKSHAAHPSEMQHGPRACARRRTRAEQRCRLRPLGRRTLDESLVRLESVGSRRGGLEGSGPGQRIDRREREGGAREASGQTQAVPALIV